MKKTVLLAVATLSLVACDNNDDNPTSPVAVQISATIGESTLTRAGETSWTAGDQIGISSIVGTVVGPYINLEYTTKDGDGKFTGTPIYFYKPMTLTAYYPFTGEEGKAPDTDGIITASTTADKQTPANQPNIDFLWDSQTGFTTSEPNVDFTFAHKMSKVTFTFQSSEAVVVNNITIAGPVNVSDMVSYAIKGLVLDGTFNTKTGVCTVKTDASDSLAIDVKDVKDNEAVQPIIVFPQTLKDGGIAKLHIYTDELNTPEHLQHYICTLTFSDGEIKPGCHYKYTIKVTKLGLIVGKMTIEPWEEAPDRFIIATIDGEKVFEEQK